MNVCPIDVRGYDKCMLPFREPHCQFIPDPISFLQSDLSRFEGLADLIADHIRLALTAMSGEISSPVQHKFLPGEKRIAFIASHQFPVLCLVRILCVIDPVLNACRGCFPLVDMQGNEFSWKKDGLNKMAGSVHKKGDKPVFSFNTSDAILYAEEELVFHGASCDSEINDNNADNRKARKIKIGPTVWIDSFEKSFTKKNRPCQSIDMGSSLNRYDQQIISSALFSIYLCFFVF